MMVHLCIGLLSLVLSQLAQGQNVGPPSARPSAPTDKPWGPYYCQARCLASCLETYLAPTLDDCQKFCPPFEENLPCPADDAKCWLTCGVPALVGDQPPPETPSLTPLVHQGSNQKEQDPFLIELGWTAVANASLYIVEFFPRNRQAKPGETNFFQVMTTSLTYTVRKEDVCVEYSARVVAVNSYGISVPAYTYVAAPTPVMNTGEHFSIRNIQKDPLTSGMITVTIDYTFPLGWNAADIDFDSLRVQAIDCRGPLGQRSFGTINVPSGVLNPSFDAIIGESPTTAIQISFYDDVLLSDCLFQMRVSSLSTRCNTTASYEQSPMLAPGIDFRLNCDSVEGACDADNDTAVPFSPPPALAPIPVPAVALVGSDSAPLSMPGFVPPGVDQPDNVTVEDIDNMPTPPALPLFIVGQSQQEPNAPVLQPVPPGLSVSIIDAAPNGSSVETMAVIPQPTDSPLCELDMFDVLPSTSPLSPSLIDLTVLWLERQPLPPRPPPLYFSIRYGPIIRKLVDDDRAQADIIPGYETIVRSVQQIPEMPFLPDPTREINITGVQRGSLLKIQVCAVYDPTSEALIQWDTMPSHRVDLAALEPFLEFENAGPSPSSDLNPIDIQDGAAAAVNMFPIPPVMQPVPVSSAQTNSNSDEVVDGTLVIAVDVDQKSPSATYWLTVLAGVLLTILTAMLVLTFLRRLCNTRRQFKRMCMHEKPMVIVKTVTPPPPAINEVMKVPLP